MNKLLAAVVLFFVMPGYLYANDHFSSTISSDNRSNYTPYVGISSGKSSIDLNSDDRTEFNVSYDYSDVNEEFNFKQFMFGYRFHRYYGSEISYISFDTFGYNLNITSSSSSSYATYRQKTSGINYRQFGYLPINNYIDLFASVGLFYMYQDVHHKYQSATSTSNYRIDFSDTYKDTKVVFGLGISSKIAGQFSARIIFEQFPDFFEYRPGYYYYSSDSDKDASALSHNIVYDLK